MIKYIYLYIHIYKDIIYWKVKKKMKVYWFLLEFLKVPKEVARDVPNKFITFDFPSIFFIILKIETDVSIHQESAGSSVENLPLNPQFWNVKNYWQEKGEKQHSSSSYGMLSLNKT